MDLKMWTPLVDLDREWRSIVDRYLHEGGETLPFRAPVNVQREEGALVVTLEMPGIDPAEDVEVAIEDDVLVISGEKTETIETKEEDWLMKERRFGRFERHIPLPDGFDPEVVAATYDKGVLTVRVPVSTQPTAGRRQIPITS
jgi:HSP20 family protein